jgi:hypothetical protein
MYGATFYTLHTAQTTQEQEHNILENKLRNVNNFVNPYVILSYIAERPMETRYCFIKQFYLAQLHGKQIHVYRGRKYGTLHVEALPDS